jgi:hypothetical protein
MPIVFYAYRRPIVAIRDVIEKKGQNNDTLEEWHASKKAEEGAHDE